MSPEDMEVITAVGVIEKWDPAYWIPFATEWEKWENTSAAFNPLASTDASVPSTGFNSAGVRNYQNVADGATATVRTLDPATHYTQFIDYYPTIRKAVQLKSIDAAGRTAVETEVRRWGTTGFANVIASGWNPTVVAPPQPLPLNADIINEALQKRFALTRLANDPELWKVEQAWNLLRGAGLL